MPIKSINIDFWSEKSHNFVKHLLKNIESETMCLKLTLEDIVTRM